MDASSLISLFGQEAGVALALNEAGTASLAFESGPVLHLEHDPQADALHCYVVLGQAPADPMRRHDVFRRMLAAVDLPVQRLVRTQVGPVRLGDLRPGKTRPLNRAEIAQLFEAVQL